MDPGSAVAGTGSVAASDAFPLFSVQAVAGLSWRLAVRTDPIGLLIVPFMIVFPVYVFFTQLAEIVRPLTSLALDARVSAGAFGDDIPFGAILGVLPLVVLAAVFGIAWIQVRADAIARGTPRSYGRTAERAFSRIWPLALTTAIVYALWQLALFLLLVPGILVFAITSFATRATTLDDLGPWAAIRLSMALVTRHWLAWLGMSAYWIILFLGLGILVGIARYSLGGIPGVGGGGFTGLAFDLVLGLPLPISFLVFDTCWTLFFRELEARSRTAAAAAAA